MPAIVIYVWNKGYESGLLWECNRLQFLMDAGFLLILAIFHQKMLMTFKIYVGKRINSRGQVELSLRFRAGNVDQRAATNIWIKYQPDMDRLENEHNTEENESIRQLMAYVEDCYCLVRRRKIDPGWLADTVERFHLEQLPLIEEEKREVLHIIDDFMQTTGASHDVYDSRSEAYMMVRRSVARFEALKRVKMPRFRLTAARLDDSCLKEIERFMLREHIHVRKHPQIARGPGLSGRTRAKGQNTVNDRMKLMRAVMNWAVKTGRIPRNPFDSFARGQNVYGTPIYLTIEERHRIEKFDLSRWPRLEVQRDIFVFQCCVGCRVSDLVRLTRGNIVDGELNYVARKTREGRPLTIKVPLNSTARRILQRYSDSTRDSLFPETYSRAGYNSVIKQILKLVGINRKVVVVNPLTREAECRRIYEVASSHMARRTFIGNIYKKFKDQGLVSELSGHAPGSNAFTRYREIDVEMKREMVSVIE